MKLKYTKALMIGAIVTQMGIESLSATQINNCADWNPCCFDYGLNPPPTCPTSCGCTWYGEIDYLYWKPYVENAYPCTVMAADTVVISTQAIPSQSNTTVKNRDFPFDWDSGYRVAIGYGFPCDKWGLALSWTHYRTDANVSENGFSEANTFKLLGANDFTMPLIGFVDDARLAVIDTFQNGSLFSKWSFQFNQIDLDFFRDFYVGCSLSIKPYVGLRVLILNHTIRTQAEYSEPNLQFVQTQIAPYSSLTLDQRLQSNLKSFGLKGGLESFWEVTCGLGVYGNVGASLIYANYENEQKLQKGSLFALQQAKVLNNDETHHFYQALKMMSDISIGIQWRQAINCNQNLVVIKAGWEHHMLLQGSQFPTIKTDSTSRVNNSQFYTKSAYTHAGDISLYGFVFSVGVSF